jgi:hypothetical protein
MKRKKIIDVKGSSLFVQHRQQLQDMVTI